MMEQFLRYSLRWNCPVKLVWLDGGQIKTGNVTVVTLEEDKVAFITARNKKTPRQLMRTQLLSAGYARGDDGDTSKRQAAKGAEE